MPCTLTEEEIQWEEERHNRENYGKDLPHGAMAYYVACAALTKLEQHGLIHVMQEVDPNILKWWANHKQADKERKKP